MKMSAMKKIILILLFVSFYGILNAQYEPGKWLDIDFGNWKIEMNDSAFMQLFEIAKDTAEKSILMMYGKPNPNSGVFIDANLDEYPDYFQYTESGLGNNSFLFMGSENGFMQPFAIPGKISKLNPYNGKDFIQMTIYGNGCCGSYRGWTLDLALRETADGYVFDTLRAEFSETYWHGKPTKYYRYAGKNFVTAFDSTMLLVMPGSPDRADAPYGGHNLISYLPTSVRGIIIHEEIYDNAAWSYVQIYVDEKFISASSHFDFLRVGDYYKAFIKSEQLWIY